MPAILTAKKDLGFVFPGQGAQKVGMGLDVYKKFPEARRVFEEADDVLGKKLSRLCFEGPEEELLQTMNAQPAILTVSEACRRAAGELPRPAFVAGHSLGEYTALVAAGALDFADAVRLTRERGRLMQEAGKVVPGGMVAIIGLDVEFVQAICYETGTQIANLNSPGQVVISGDREALVRATDLARAMGARHAMPLKVSGAFHSSLMNPAVEGLSKAIGKVKFHCPTVPVVANATAKSVTTPEEIKSALVRQICDCVRWQDSVTYMRRAGVSTFVEIGPGQVLSGLIKRIDKQAQTVNLGDAEAVSSGININAM